MLLKVQRHPPTLRYEYLVLPGNESSIVVEALSRRPWWKAVREDEVGVWSFWWGGNGQRCPWAQWRKGATLPL